ncbi:helix-turn-helix domain-containing protein [Herbiconiux moechotypicola]|uniref:Helix-turn-helix domain-containing protein n=1 Tax=Herbiconiux moechotypicola TaxID=637393 RepID=A0ABP5QFW1_9MICO|nr:helix-turn-helix domain-containing protein [Herbiconiux moechotypicola]MCS5730041.1 helix-turn-helix domain-containing protein [Herbiconiux moechotypicola]
MTQPQSRGHLNPGDPSVVFDRFELGAGLEHLVRHVWVVSWALPVGTERPQRVLSYPAVNVVFQPTGTVLAGPDPRVSITTLRGTSWGVGVLFRPAATLLLQQQEAKELLGAIIPFPVPGTDAAVASAMHGTDPSTRRLALVAALRRWLAPIAARMGERGLLANEVSRLAETDPGILRSSELADRCSLSVRSLERLVREQIGVTPKWLIECRRLQEAATTLHAHPETDLSALAAELGYADYPHFSRRYIRFVGEPPTRTTLHAHARPA